MRCQFFLCALTLAKKIIEATGASPCTYRKAPQARSSRAISLLSPICSHVSFHCPGRCCFIAKNLYQSFQRKKGISPSLHGDLLRLRIVFFYKKGLMVRSMGVLRILFIPCVCPRAPNSPQNAPPAGSSSKSEESGQPKQTPQCHTKKQSHQQRPDKNNISRAK